MEEDVRITIKGYHTIDGAEQEPVVTSARGRYAFRNGRHFVRYEEKLPDNEGVSKAMVRFSDDGLFVKKTGAYESQMEFREGKRLPVHYRTPAGDVAFEVEADAVEYEERDGQLEIRVQYGLHAGGSRIQDSRVEISVRPYSPAGEYGQTPGMNGITGTE